jgi:hypothetical protein
MPTLSLFKKKFNTQLLNDIKSIVLKTDTVFSLLKSPIAMPTLSLFKKIDT